jgi:hypothetical protein
MITREELDRLSRLAKDASPLPWSGAGQPPCILDAENNQIFLGTDSNKEGQHDNWNDIWYIEDAANSIPALIDAIQEAAKLAVKQQARIAELEEAANSIIKAIDSVTKEEEEAGIFVRYDWIRSKLSYTLRTQS